MKNIIIIGGMLMSLYFKNNTDSWSLSSNPTNIISEDVLTISSNPNNIISEDVLTIIDKIPSIILDTLYYIILILCITSILKNNKIKNLLYPIALLILTIGTKITCNMLSFEDFTDLWLFIIHHPISLETKQYYLLMQLESIIRYHYTPEIYLRPEIIQEILNQLTPQILNTNWELFKQKSPSEITQYACELLNLELSSNRYMLQLFVGLISYALIHNLIKKLIFE